MDRYEPKCITAPAPAQSSSHHREEGPPPGFAHGQVLSGVGGQAAGLLDRQKKNLKFARLFAGPATVLFVSGDMWALWGRYLNSDIAGPFCVPSVEVNGLMNFGNYYSPISVQEEANRALRRALMDAAESGRREEAMRVGWFFGRTTI